MELPRSHETTLTVGPTSGDVVGSTGAAIQIAIDALSFRGGGTVRVEPGEYELIDSIRMRANVKLIGTRGKTLLRRHGPLVWADLAEDADVGQAQIRPTRIDHFTPGMGLMTRDDSEGWAVSPPISVMRIDDGLLHLNEYLQTDRRAECSGKVFNYFGMIYGQESPNVHIEGLTIDAGVDDPAGVLGTMRRAAIYLYRCPDSVIRDVTVINCPGDGICVGKTSLRCNIENCETAHNGFYGIHPGSHSAYTNVRNCHIHHNAADGLYICWGIVGGEFTGNHIHHNGLGIMRSGICIGHKDTDNLIADNHIHDNKKHGIAFRQKTQANGAHRNTVRNNMIENNGSRPEEFAELKAKLGGGEAIHCGIQVCGITEDLRFENNVIRETRTGDDRTQRHGIWLTEGVSRVTLEDNTIEGHIADAVRDDAGAVIGETAAV